MRLRRQSIRLMSRSEREKHDIRDVVRKIRESVAVKAAEAHRLEREQREEDQ